MRELLRELERSGLSLHAFTEAAEVPYTTMSWWRSRLRGSETAPRPVPVHVKVPAQGVVGIVVGDVVVLVTDAEDTASARLVRAMASC